MAVVNGVSTFRDVKRRRKEGVQVPELAPEETAGVPVQKTTAEKIAEIPAGPETIRPGVSSFDPKLIGRGGLAAAAGAPVTPFTAGTLEEMADLVNEQAKKDMEAADAVPTTAPVSIPEPETTVVEEVKPPTFKERIEGIQAEAETQRQAIQSEPARLTKAQDIADIAQQEKADLANIKAEEKLILDEQKRLGTEFKQDILEEKIAASRDIAEREGISLTAAAQRFDQREKEKAKLDPDKTRSFDATIEQITAPDFDAVNAYDVAITEFEKDGVDADDMDNANKAVAAVFGKNFADEAEDNFLIDVRKLDPAIVQGDRKLIDARKIGETVKSGQAGGRVTNSYLKTIFDIDQSLVPDAINQILTSPTATDDAKRQASAFSADFFADVETGIAPKRADKDFLTEAAFKAGEGTAEERARFRSGTLELSQLKEGSSISGGILAPSIVAQNIMSGVGDLNDVLTKNRQPVLQELSKLKDESLAAGNLRGVLAASAIHGDKNPSDSFLQSFSKGRSVINQLGELKTLMFKDGYLTEEGESIDLTPLSGWLAERNPWDTDSQKIKAILQQTVPNLARGVFGEVGVLTDKDVELYRKTLPNLRSTEAVQQAVLGITLKAVQKSLENQIETQALGGRNMSRFTTAYDDIVAKTDELMGLRDLPEGIEEVFNKATPKQQEQMIEKAKNSFFKVAPLRESKQQSSDERSASTEIIDTGIESVLPGQTIKTTPGFASSIKGANQELQTEGLELKIADSFRSTEVQKESFESGKAGVAPPGLSFHEKGEAIDLSQSAEDGMNNEKVFAALRKQGLRQNPLEWWHWSRGEFNNT